MDDAIVFAQKSIEIQQTLVAENPTVVAYAIGLAAAYCNMGHYVKRTGEPSASLRWFGEAIRTLHDILDRNKRGIDAREFLRNSYVGRAQALTQLGRYDEAVSDWGEAIAFAEERDRVFFRVQRAIARAKAKDHVKATEEAEELVSDASASGVTLYNVACVFSLSSRAAADDLSVIDEERHELSDQYAARAVELLAEARDIGYFNKPAVEHLEKDSDIDPLRDRPDFQKLEWVF